MTNLNPRDAFPTMSQISGHTWARVNENVHLGRGLSTHILNRERP